MKKTLLGCLLGLGGTLAAQQEVCVPVFTGTGSYFPWPPVVGGATVIPGTHTSGNCPNGYCTFNFDVLMALTSPNGLSFEVCFDPPVPPLCVPYGIPIDPNFPPVTQVLDESYTVSVQCTKSQLIKLDYLGLLGPVNVATIDMTCDNRDC